MRVHFIKEIHGNNCNVFIRNVKQPLRVVNNQIKGKHVILKTDYLTQKLSLKDIQNFKNDINLCMESSNYEKLSFENKIIKALKEICIEWSSYEL